MEIQFKKLTKTAKAPSKDTRKSAGYDLYADIAQPVLIPATETVKIRTGISFKAPEGYFGAIFARNGLSSKKGLAPANKVAILCEDFSGECVIALHNSSTETQIVTSEEKIAQIVFIPYFTGGMSEIE